MGFFLGNKDIGIDLGTANTLIYIKDKGIVLNEPSVIAVNSYTNKIIAVGQKAKDMRGKAPKHIEVIFPLEEGVIFDFEMAAEMLKVFFKLASKKISFFMKMRVVVGVPSGVTDVEKRTVEEIMRDMGAKYVYILDEPMAAAIGLDIQISGTISTFIADIGGGTSDIAVIALDGIITFTSIRHAGNNIDRAIIQYMRKEHKLLIGEKTAEEIKIEIGTVFLSEEDLEAERTYEARGRDILSGNPKTVLLSSKDVFGTLVETVEPIIDAIKKTFEHTPPEMAADIQKTGITLTGGGSFLKGLDKLITKETGIKVFVPENAKTAVAEGTGKALSDIKMLSMYESNKKLHKYI